MSSDEKLRRAKQPTVKRLLELAERTSPHVKAVLKVIAKRYCDSDAAAFEILREAKATEWHAQLFKRELGITLWRLIEQCRKDTASILMRDTSLSIAEIAGLVGYGTADSFGKRYKALAGVPPSTMKACLRQVLPEQRAAVDDFLSWYFWVRYHRGELHAADFRAAIDVLRDRPRPA